MDYVIVVPSYGRVKGFRDKTLATLQRYRIPKERIYLFVANDEQREAYEGVRDEVGHIVIGKKGLCEVRNFIFEYFPVGTRIVSFDDDVRGFVRLEDGRCRELRVEEFGEMVETAFRYCERVGARLWGDYPVPNAFFMRNTITRDLKFIMGSFWGCVNPGSAVAVWGGGEKEDYQRTIQFFELDRAVVRLNMISHKTTTYSGTGGLNDSEHSVRLAREEAMVTDLLSRYPQYLRRNLRRKSPYPELALRSVRGNSSLDEVLQTPSISLE